MLPKKQLPRIKDVWVDPGAVAVKIIWKGSRPDYVALGGWIASGGDILAPLKNPDTFRSAKVANFGTAVAWDNNDDLAIDAVHLKQLADEQRPFTNKDLRGWQSIVKVSNTEAAQLAGVSLSTWNAYRAGVSEIPTVLGIALRASLRDPIIMQAHMRPAKPAGRPRKQA